MTIAIECKSYWRFLVGIAAICSFIALHLLQVGTSSSGSSQQHQQRILRSRLPRDPKSTSPRTDASNNAPPTPVGENIDPANIHFYVKTSGKSPYIERAMQIADTWGRDAAEAGGFIEFLFDNNNHEAVDEFAKQRPWALVRHVEGTDHQGDYKGEITHNKSALEAAHKAQRLKTRAVFVSEAEIDTNTPAADWVCYLDDDMVVNMSNLQVDLREKEPACSPDCLVADRADHGGIQYTGGGWCMNRHLAQRAGELLREKTDEDLNWAKTDDLSFNRYVMQGALGVFPTDSERFYSELALRGGIKKIEGMSRQKFSEEVTPSLAVYHMGYTFEYNHQEVHEFQFDEFHEPDII